MQYKTIDWEIEDSIGRLVLNRPPANTMTRHFFDELNLIVRNTIPQAGVKALIIYGSGRHFSSGADLPDLGERIKENMAEDSLAIPGYLPDFLLETAQCFRMIENFPFPVFAAIRGACLGSALELALSCHFRVCAEGAVLGFPETSFGLMPGCGGTIRSAMIAGHSKAIELILTGRNFTAEEAYSNGFVHKIVRRKQLIEETVSMAKRMIDRKIWPPYTGSNLVADASATTVNN